MAIYTNLLFISNFIAILFNNMCLNVTTHKSKNKILTIKTYLYKITMAILLLNILHIISLIKILLFCLKF